MTLVCLVCGYKTVNHLLEIKDQASYIQNYNIFVGCLLAVCIVVGSIIVIDVTKTLKKSIDQLSDAASQMAAGKMDVNLVKLRDDEFAIQLYAGCVGS